MASVTVTATPDPGFAPPRVDVTVTADSGYLLTSGSLYRVQSGQRTLVRTQPLMGQPTQLVEDYEAPYGSPVTFEFIGLIAPTGGGSSTSVDVASSLVTLSPASGWVVHPLTPSLSVPVSVTDRTLIGINNIGDVSNVANSTTHAVLGQQKPIVSTTGPRLSDAFTVIWAARNPTHMLQLAAVAADQTPLLIRFPVGSVDWPDDFYSVGTTTGSRWAQNPQVPRRVVTWPLQSTQPPVGSVANPSSWTYSALASQYASYDAVVGEFATYATLQQNIPEV